MDIETHQTPPYYIINDALALCRLPVGKDAEDVAIRLYFASAETWKTVQAHKSMDSARSLLCYGSPCRCASWLVYGAVLRVFTDGEIDVLFTRATSLAAVSNSELIFAEARLMGVRQIIAQAAKRVSYKQGDSTENLSDLLKNYQVLLSIYTQERDDLLNAVRPTMKLVGLRVKNPRQTTPDEG